MPDTRPGLKFRDGVCVACVHYKQRKTVNWKNRNKELEKICKKFRGKNGDGYDCAIAVSGGKDSHYQVYYMKEVMKMNPVLISVGNIDSTKTGQKNLDNLCEIFSCDMILHKPNLDLTRKLSKITFKEIGSPTWYIDSLIYSFPVRMAMKLNLKLLIYGEDVNYTYGGKYDTETFSAKLQSKNDVVKPIHSFLSKKYKIDKKELFSCIPPKIDDYKKFQLEPIYLSYFVPWDSYHNFLVAQRYGFSHLGHEYKREGTIEDYNSIDSITYLLNQYLKYPKFGHASATEMASRWIRSGMKSRDEMINYVQEYDDKLDQGIIDGFCNFTKITKSDFWEIMDKWYNKDLFEQDDDGIWKKKFQVGKNLQVKN